MHKTPLAAALLAALSACASQGDRSVSNDTDFVGAYSRPATTSSPEAKQFFDRGLQWAYGFNHDAAIRCFKTAQRLDPDFALAYWGEAWALGPNINAPLEDPAVAKAAWTAAQAAKSHDARASGEERALIDALLTRYAEDPSKADRAALDSAFATAMGKAHEQFPHDPDIAAIYADAILNTRPWDYWEKDGSPKAGVADALATLRSTLREHPDHAGAHHFMIHVTESSPHPEEGLPSARVLAALAPGAGHLVHMPAHTLHRLGRYYEAEECNRRAVEVDRAFFARHTETSFYLFYLTHNHHFRAWSAMYGGRFEIARLAAHDLVADLPPNATTELAPFVDGYLPAVLHVLVRFGKWDELLAYPAYADNLPLANTMRHYARGVAFAATGKVAEARAEQQAFEATAKGVDQKAKFGINDALPVIDIARTVLEGETLYREGKFDDAFATLRRGVQMEDDLRYDEPSPWMMPVRHALGALLVEQGRIAEAEQVYRDDLAHNPENGWSLHGLSECLGKQGKLDEQNAVQARFAVAWAHADTKLDHGSCFCRSAGASSGN
ncbi:MAG: hypothetical protein U1F36_05585 [Planctomycetota bacterium]